jgi:hypothetical protein
MWRAISRADAGPHRGSQLTKAKITGALAHKRVFLSFMNH